MARRPWGLMIAIALLAACGGQRDVTATAAQPEPTASTPDATATAAPTPTEMPTPTPAPTPTTAPTSTPAPLTSTTTDVVDGPVSFVADLGGGLELWCPPVPTVHAQPDYFGLEVLPLGTITPEDEAELADALARWFSPPDDNGIVELVDIGPTIVVPHDDGAIVGRLIGGDPTRVDVAVHLRRTTDGWAGTWLRACSGLNL